MIATNGLILKVSILKEVTRVLHFREESLQPLDIGPNKFFQRYSVGFESGDISVSELSNVFIQATHPF